jgi:hypothetical protein
MSSPAQKMVHEFAAETLKRVSGDAAEIHAKRAKTDTGDSEESGDDNEDGDENEGDEVLTKECSVCHTNKLLIDFHRWSMSPDGRRVQCKICRSGQANTYNQRIMQNSDHFVNRLIRHCKLADKRNDIEESTTLTEADVHEMYAEQQMRCHATFVPIFLKQGEWQASIDRIVGGDNGHTRNNVQLSALEVNTQVHWTKELVRSLIAKSSEEFGDFQAVADMVLSKRTLGNGKTFTWPVITRDGESFVYCHTCETEKKLDEFSKHLRSGCKACKMRIDAEYAKTWRGVFSKLLSNSKRNTKTRNRDRRNRKSRNHGYDIDIEYVAELFVQQEGRCFYSGAPLTTDGPFKCSLERIDVSLGYIKGNVCLIVMMMNSNDYFGETGWSRNKFIYMVEQFKAHDS